MARCLPSSRSGPLGRSVSLGFELVSKLVQLVEIDPGLEPEPVRNRFGRSMPTRSRLLAEAGAERPIDDVLERQSELACAPFQQSGQIIIDGERGAHEKHRKCGRN